MADVFANRSDWLVKAIAMKPGDERLTIHPLDGLTTKMMQEALSAQKILHDANGRLAFQAVQHGTKVFLYRKRTST